MVACPYKRDGTCEIASDLSGLPVSVDEAACGACQRQPDPRARNRVTCGLAVQARRTAGLPVATALLQQAAGYSHIGDCLGEEIERARRRLARLHLDWLIPTVQCQACAQLRARLNTMTGRQVRGEYRELARQMAQRWEQSVPAAGWLPLREQLIARALRRAVNKARTIKEGQ